MSQHCFVELLVQRRLHFLKLSEPVGVQLLLLLLLRKLLLLLRELLLLLFVLLL